MESDVMTAVKDAVAKAREADGWVSRQTMRNKMCDLMLAICRRPKEFLSPGWRSRPMGEVIDDLLSGKSLDPLADGSFYTDEEFKAKMAESYQDGRQSVLDQMPIQSGEVHWFSEKSLRRYTNSVAWIAASRFAGIEATRDYPTDKQLDTLVDLGLKAVDAPVDAPVETPIEDRRRGPGGEPSKAEEMADKTVASFQQFRMRREPIPAKPVHLNPLPENDPRMHIVRFTDDFFHGCVVDFSKNGVGENLSSEIIDHHIKKLLDRLFSLVAPMIDPAETPAKPKVKRYTLEEALVQVGNDTINQWFHFTVHPKAASIVKLHVGQFQDRYESNNREFYPESELDWS